MTSITILKVCQLSLYPVLKERVSDKSAFVSGNVLTVMFTHLLLNDTFIMMFILMNSYNKISYES